MLAIVRRKLDRARAALGFNEARPAEEEGMAALFTQLAAAVKRAEAGMEAATDLDVALRSHRRRARERRRLLTKGLLRVLARAGRAAGLKDAAVEQDFGPVQLRGSAAEFGAGARVLVDGGRRHQPALAEFGVTAATVERAEALLAEHTAAVQEAAGALAGRVTARAGLRVIGNEIMDLLVRLDGLMQDRFADEPAELQGWRSSLAAPGPLQRRRVRSEGGPEVEAPESEQPAA